MDKKSVTVVLYNRYRPELFFSVAAIIKEWESRHNDVIAVAADPALMGNEEELRFLIAEHLSQPESDPYGTLYADEDIGDQDANDEDFYDEYLEDEDEDDDILWDDDLYDRRPELLTLIPPTIRYCILDIGPRNSADMENIISFLDRHETEISLWVDTSHDWFKNELTYVKPFVQWRREESPLALLKQMRYRAPRRWLRAERVLRNLAATTRQELAKNPIAYRYYQAISASRVISRNNQADDSGHVFMSIAWECADRINYFLVDDMCSCYEDMQIISAEALNSISSNWKRLKLLKKIGRPAGYLNLDLTPDHTDVEYILNEGSRKFPWLFVLVYRLDCDFIERMDAVSDKLGQRWQYAAANGYERIPKKKLASSLRQKILLANPPPPKIKRPYRK